MSVVPVRTSPLKPIPLFNHPDGAWREPSSLSKVETPLENERVISRVRETGCRYHSPVPPVRWHWLPRGTEEDGVWSRCWLGAGLSRSSHSPPPSARLHSYSPPFDLHVGSNCGAASPARHPGTSSARPAAPRHSCISTLPARLAPSNTCKYNTNTNQIQVQISINIHIKI